MVVVGYNIGTYIFNTRKLSITFVLISGSFISLIGFLCASFTTSPVFFIIFYGVFSGIGCGMMYLPPL